MGPGFEGHQMRDKRRKPHSSPIRAAQTAPSGRRATISRALSKLGFCSRTQAEILVRTGRVTVAGRVTTNIETWVDLDKDRIAVDGETVAAEAFIYLMLNKPRGLVTTRSDPEGRPTVFECLKGVDHAHLSPVGRLDKASEGLLLFTNDTRFANALLDPATHVAKTYHVQADRLVGEEELAAMLRGLDDGGETLRAKKASLLRAGDKTCWLEIELDEGRNRQIRRMLEALDIATLRLVRVAIGPLPLGELEKGGVRELTAAELEALRRASGHGV
jgi:23S rRNA pseudouridine2605 synthase